MKIPVNTAAVRKDLLRLCDEAGGQRPWAIANGVSPQYVSDVLKARRDPGDAILTAMGLRRVISYERIA